MLTAGVMDKLGKVPGMENLAKSPQFTDKLTYNLINAGGRALTNAAINGDDLEAALKQAIVSGLVDTAHGELAGQIKGLEADWLAHKLAHALAGCVAGAAASGTCQDGAIGAAVGEMVGQLFEPENKIAYSDAEKAKILAYSKLVAGGISAYTGGDAQTAITTSETAVRNNALVPVLVGLAWAADRAITAYQVSQDLAAIRDGTKTVAQIAAEKDNRVTTTRFARAEPPVFPLLGDAQKHRQATFHLDQRIRFDAPEGWPYLFPLHRHGLVHHHLRRFLQAVLRIRLNRDA
jgi:hypothetical protein